MTAATGKTALIIGASRGLGLALAAAYLARGWLVTATARGARPAAPHELAASAAGRLVVKTVDITIPEQVAALHDRLAGTTYDLLFVNAGVTNGPQETVADVSTDTFTRLMVTNARASPAWSTRSRPRPVTTDCSTWTTGARPSAGSACGPPPTTWRAST